MVITKKNKKQKSSQELGIEILEQQKNEKIWDNYVEDQRKLCEIKLKQSEIKLKQILEDNDQFKYEKIKEAGLFLNKLQIFPKNQTSTKISNAFKGYIARRYVRFVCSSIDKKWMNSSKDHSEDFFKHKNGTISSEKLSPIDQAFVDAHEKELIRNKQIAEIIESLTNKDVTEQGEIIGRANDSKTDFRKLLVEESEEYMKTVVQQMTPSNIEVNLWEHRTLRQISERFSDILYEEKERRQRTAHLNSV